MSIRRPQWVRRLAFVIFELTDPAGAARLRMSRGALVSPEGARTGRSLGSLSGDTSALTEGEALSRCEPRPAWSTGQTPGLSPSVSASADVVSLPGASSPLLGARPRTSVPGLGRTRSLFWFGFVVLGLPLGVAAATLAGAVT